MDQNINYINQLEKILKELADTVSNDPNLTEELREDLLDMIAEVRMEPSPANIEVLATVLTKLQDTSKYLASLQIIQNFANP